MSVIKPGVCRRPSAIFKLAKQKKFALPLIRYRLKQYKCCFTSKELNSPVIIQFSNGGACFNAGKSLDNTNQSAAIAGAIAGANIFIHWQKPMEFLLFCTDHCTKKLLPWIDGLIEASEEHYKEHGNTL